MKQQLQGTSDARSSAAGERPRNTLATQQMQGTISVSTLAFGYWGVILTIVLVGAAVAALVLTTDDGARIDALADGMAAGFHDAATKRAAGFRDLNAKMAAGFRDANEKMAALFRDADEKRDALDAKVEDLRVYMAAVHGDRITFTPIKAAESPAWLIQALDRETQAVQDIGKLTVQAGAQRWAVLELDGGPRREWIHFDRAGTLRRAKRLMALATAP